MQVRVWLTRDGKLRSTIWQLEAATCRYMTCDDSDKRRQLRMQQKNAPPFGVALFEDRCPAIILKLPDVLLPVLYGQTIADM